MTQQTLTRFEVTVGKRAPVVVEARSWLSAMEATMSPPPTPPSSGWDVRPTSGGVEVWDGGERIARVQVASKEAPAPRADAGTTVAAHCANALDDAHRIVKAEAGAVLLLDGHNLRFEAVTGPRAESLLGMRISASLGVAGYALQLQRPVLVGATSDDPRHYHDIDALTGFQTSALVAVPIAHGGTAVGVLELINPPTDRPFRARDLPAVERITRLLAQAVMRARS